MKCKPDHNHPILKDVLSSPADDSATTLPPEKEAWVPQKAALVSLLDHLFALLYPAYRPDSKTAPKKLIEEAHDILRDQIFRAIRMRCLENEACEHCPKFVETTIMNFWKTFPDIRRLLETDVHAAFDGDPAATGFDEIILAYPGFYAVTTYRLAHSLAQLSVPLIPRMMTEHAHQCTGIDIHPGARIGERFFIDHGTGVVIGETTDIGRNVKLYQGVTLGALSFKVDERGRVIREGKRHPTLEDDVVVYAGATILGGKTVIGEGATIGGNTWVTHSVAPESRVIIQPPEQRIDSGKG